jgi:hypothetical protein
LQGRVEELEAKLALVEKKTSSASGARKGR